MGGDNNPSGVDNPIVRLNNTPLYLGSTLKAEHMDKLEGIKEDIFEFPADTRPGYNTSLLLYMLTVSAIAVAIYQSKYGLNNHDLQVLRLVSLLHDIGKMNIDINNLRKCITIGVRIERIM